MSLDISELRVVILTKIYYSNLGKNLPVVNLTKILAKISVVNLAKILAKIPVVNLTKILAKIPVVNLTKILAKIPVSIEKCATTRCFNSLIGVFIS